MINNIITIFCMFLFLAVLPGCDNVKPIPSKLEKVSSDTYVIVKSTDPEDEKIKYGAFLITSELHRKDSNKLHWIFISNGEKNMNIRKSTVVMGQGETSESLGVKFQIYSLRLSIASKNEWWLNENPPEFKNHYSTEFCLTTYKNIGELNGVDFSECFNSFNQNLRGR